MNSMLIGSRKTRQKAPNEKGFVGYETIWKPLQKEVEYKTPEKP